jgi:hypothetical protein
MCAARYYDIRTDEYAEVTQPYWDMVEKLLHTLLTENKLLKTALGNQALLQQVVVSREELNAAILAQGSPVPDSCK